MMFSRIIYIILILALPFQIQGQKVGLVLSGGGSRGMAHIGVIKALEENNIPIDYIAGTSIGAIIGSLYACGFSPEEITQILSTKRVQHWIDQDLQKHYSYYFKQSPEDASWFQINLNPQSQYFFELPSSLLSPALMDFAFMEYLSGPSAAANYNFDSLFIPFRCVSADITNNQPYIFSEGNLSIAVRASMTFPFYFKPIQHEGRVMFDGGMYNNFPTDIMQTTFWPDVIIGSKVSTNYPPPSEDNIVSQLQNMLMVDSDYSMEDYTGVLIEPNVPGSQLIDFSKNSIMIDSGFQAALRHMEVLKSMIPTESDPKILKKKREFFRSKVPEIIIDTVYAFGVKSSQIEYLNRAILHESRFSEIENVKQEYLNLYSDQMIDHIFPYAKFNEQSGLFDLTLNIKLRKGFQTSFGGHLSSSPFNQAYLRLDYNRISLQAFQFSFSTHIGRFYNAARFRARVTHSTKVPFYFETSLNLNGYDYFGPNQYFYQEQDPSYLIHQDNFWAVDFGFPATRKGKILLSFNTGRITNRYYQMESFQKTDTADINRLNYISPKFTFEVNSLNKKQYPSEGHFVKTRLWYFSGLEEYNPGNTTDQQALTDQRYEIWKLQFVFKNYMDVASFMTLGLSGEIILSTQKPSSNYTSTILLTNQYSPTPTSKILFLPKYRAFNYIAFGIETIMKLFKHSELRFEGHFFQPYREIVKNKDFTAKLEPALSSTNYTLSSSIIYHTRIGRLALAWIIIQTMIIKPHLCLTLDILYLMNDHYFSF